MSSKLHTSSIFIAAFKVKNHLGFKTIDLTPDDIITGVYFQRLTDMNTTINKDDYFIDSNSNLFKRAHSRTSYRSVVTGTIYTEVTELFNALKTNCVGKLPLYILLSGFRNRFPFHGIEFEGGKEFPFSTTDPRELTALNVGVDRF